MSQFEGLPHLRRFDCTSIDMRQLNRLMPCSIPDSQANLVRFTALLKSDLHPFVTVGEIREGSYVHVTKYQLARGQKLVGDGYILYV